MRLGLRSVRVVPLVCPGACERRLCDTAMAFDGQPLFTQVRRRGGGGPRRPAHHHQHTNHAQSRTAGRAAARASPLSHNISTDGARPAHDASRAAMSSEGEEAGSASTSSHFGSTRFERHFDPMQYTVSKARHTATEADEENVSPRDGARASATAARSSPTMSFFSSSSAPLSTPVVAPYSALAYRARLGQGRVQSLVELAHAPYAPGSLRVLLDVMRVLAAARSADPSDEASPRVPSVSPEARRRLVAALARTSDVAILLNEVVQEVQEVVKAAEELSDRESMVEKQAMMDLVEQFVSVLMDAAPSQPVAIPTTDMNAVAVQEVETGYLTESVYAEALHGALRMARHLSLYKTALLVLEEVLKLDEERRQRSRIREDISTGGRSAELDEAAEDCFALDAVVSVVEKEMSQRVRPVTAVDHLLAMESCASGGEFAVALMLYKRLLQHAQMGYVSVTGPDLERGLVALANGVRNAIQFAELQELLIGSEAAQSVPVSVPLYTALIGAVSHAEENPERMSIALALYRRLRDGGLTPSVETYSALMACCASCKEPTHAFAFYHEARLVCGGPSALTPAIYTNLLLSYANAGYGADAQNTLEVLVEAGAPLTRAAFHAVLAGSPTLREAQAVLGVMTSTYHIPPTPHTYAFLVQAAAKQPSGVNTALHVFDLHEAALHALSEMMPHMAAAQSSPMVQTTPEGDVGGAGSSGGLALSSSPGSAQLEGVLLERYPHYVQALAHALMKLRIDPHLDKRLQPYLNPLVRLAQRQMNAFTGGMPPQAPTYVPEGPQTCVAVLAPDVLAHLDELVEPFMTYYTAIVIPYSALLALGVGGARRRVDGVHVKGIRAALHDSVWEAAGDEQGAVVAHRRRRLIRFLEQYRDTIHLVSLEEELTWSRDVARYGIAAKDWHARSAAIAIQLARRDNKAGFRLYAEAGSTLVLVSTNFNRCGRYVVDLKKQYGVGQRSAEGVEAGDVRFPGLCEGLSRVLYHNPRTQPQWAPPSLSASGIRKAVEDAAQTETSSTSKRSSGNLAHAKKDREAAEHPEAAAAPYVDAVPENAAAMLYMKLVHASDVQATSAPTARAGVPNSENETAAVVVKESTEDMLDAALLLEMMNS